MPIALPAAPAWRNASITPIQASQRFRSALSGVTQVVAKPGGYWRAEFALPPLSAAQAREWSAVLMQLAGGADRVYLAPPIKNVLPAMGSPVINGANQTGQALSVSGITAGAVIPAGTWLSFATATFRSLHVTVASATANGSGVASLAIRHAIRKSPTNGGAVNFATPTGEFLLEGQPPALSADLQRYALSLAFVEAVIP